MHAGIKAKGNRTQNVAAQLRGEILSGAVPVDHRIAGEHELMSRFSASRQTVREALRELSTQGLVVSRCGPGGGAFVARPDRDRLSDMLSSAGAMLAVGEEFPYEEVSIAIFSIEAACCRLAAERRDTDAIACMRNAIAAAANPPSDPRTEFDGYTAFNRALWAAAGNGPLAFIMQAFMQALRGKLPTSQSPRDLTEHRTFLDRNHRAILAAIEAGDGARAVAHQEENLAFWLAHPVDATS